MSSSCCLGIMGSVLEKDGRDVWALSGGSIVSAIRTLGGSIGGLTLGGDAATREVLDDGVTATRLMPDTHLIPNLWKIDGYSEVSNYIRREFDAQTGRNYFVSLGIAITTRRRTGLRARHASGCSRGAKVRQRRCEADSPGALDGRPGLSGISLKCSRGWRDARMLVTFGAPYRGSLNALDFLANGLRKSVGPFDLRRHLVARPFVHLGLPADANLSLL